nr:MAG: capsid protein [Cressdnaviricota sp.]
MNAFVPIATEIAKESAIHLAKHYLKRKGEHLIETRINKFGNKRTMTKGKDKHHHHEGHPKITKFMPAAEHVAAFDGERMQTDDIAEQILDPTHPVERFPGESKKLHKKHKKKHHKKTLKQKVKKIIKQASVALGPREVYVENQSGGVITLPAFTAAWNTTMNQVVAMQDNATHTVGFGFRCWNGPALYTGTTSVAGAGVDIMGAVRNAGEQNITFTKPGTGIVETSGPNPVASSAAATFYGMQPDLLQTKIWISDYHYQMAINNSTAVALVYDIYEFQAQRNMTPNDPYRCLGTAITQIRTDLNSKVTNEITANPLLSYGYTPEDIPGLSKHWKIINRTRVLLAAAGSTSFTWKGPKGWFNVMKNANICTLKHMTTEFMVIAGNGPAFGVTAVSAGAITTHRKIHFRLENGAGRKGVDSATLQVEAD